MIEAINWFVNTSFAQLAGVSLFMAGLCVYAWWTRGRANFLTELMVYLTAFVAFSVAHVVFWEELDRVIARRAFALLAFALWVHVALMIRMIVRRLGGYDDE